MNTSMHILYHEMMNAPVTSSGILQNNSLYCFQGFLKIPKLNTQRIGDRPHGNRGLVYLICFRFAK
jgi:hypothetical protein